MKPQAQMVLRMLREAGDDGVGMGDFIDARCLRYGARIDELRCLGYGVETVHLSGSSYVYRLLDEPDLEVSDGGEKGPELPPAPTPVAPVADPEAEPISLFDVADVPSRPAMFDQDAA